MVSFSYQPPFQFGKDATKYRLLSTDGVELIQQGERSFLKISSDALSELSRQAFSDVNYLYRTAHLEGLRRVYDDPEASDNDRFVSLALLKNAVISVDRILPSCQDTGTAKIYGIKGQEVWTSDDDAQALSKGVFETYTTENLRYSQNAALSLYEEANTKCNLPAQIDLMAGSGNEYKFLFMAKGGGSANKMTLYQETKAILDPKILPQWISERLGKLGTAACPPYHLAIVIGGTSAEATMKTLSLASAGYLDTLPGSGSPEGRAFRDVELEAQVMKMARNLGIGAQFGGASFAHDVRVIRLPRHGASLPVGIGLSCSADRNIKGKITPDGIFLEQLDTDPVRFLPGPDEVKEEASVAIDLNQPMADVCAQLSEHPILTRVLLTGKMVVARDLAHARFRDMQEEGKPLPDYLKKHPVYYAGPAKTPDGMASGSFGPTTAARMDPYVGPFQKEGASLVMLAKGNRHPQVMEACRQYGGFYLGSIGGPAAQLAQDHITEVKVLDFEELGMEAVWEIAVKDFPAFIIIDDKGNDFFNTLLS